MARRQRSLSKTSLRQHDIKEQAKREQHTQSIISCSTIVLYLCLSLVVLCPLAVWYAPYYEQRITATRAHETFVLTGHCPHLISANPQGGEQVSLETLMDNHDRSLGNMLRRINYQQVMVHGLPTNCSIAETFLRTPVWLGAAIDMYYASLIYDMLTASSIYMKAAYGAAFLFAIYRFFAELSRGLMNMWMVNRLTSTAQRQLASQPAEQQQEQSCSKLKQTHQKMRKSHLKSRTFPREASSMGDDSIVKREPLEESVTLRSPAQNKNYESSSEEEEDDLPISNGTVLSIFSPKHLNTRRLVVTQQ